MANKRLIKLCILFCVALLGACKSSVSLYPDEYLAYLINPDNGLIKENKMNDVQMSVEYKPASYLALVEADKFSLIKNQSTIDSLTKNYTDQYFFILKIAVTDNNDFLKAGITNQEEFYKRIEYYQTQFINDIYLTDGNDTITCLSANMERNYGIAPQTNFSLLFENTKHKASFENDLCIIINDQILGTSKNIFCFQKKALNNIPTLNIE